MRDKLQEKAFYVVASCKTIEQYACALRFVDLVTDRLLERNIFLNNDRVNIIRWGGFMRGLIMGIILEKECDRYSYEDRLP